MPWMGRSRRRTRNPPRINPNCLRPSRSAGLGRTRLPNPELPRFPRFGLPFHLRAESRELFSVA